MPTLSEKWGTKEAWLRTLYLRANIMWLFRQEMVRLELDELRWLKLVLKDSYLAAKGQADRFASLEEAFRSTVELVRDGIEQRIELFGSDNELKKLLELTNSARPCDAIQEIFDNLTRNTKSIYRKAQRRKLELERHWLIGHPLGSQHPGEFPDPYHLNALTKVQPALSTVELQIHLDEFDVTSLLAIPALLTHELVCHAYASEDRSDSRSTWAEGVMDWTAMFFFERWGLKLNLPYGLIKGHGDDLWERRMTPARFTGRAIADTLVQWWTGDASVRGPTMARQVTAKLAVEVNIASVPLLAKDTLASRIANIWSDEPLQQALRDWRVGSTSAVAIVG